MDEDKAAFEVDDGRVLKAYVTGNDKKTTQYSFI